MLVFVIVFHFILLFIIYIFFHFIYLYFCHLFLVLKLEFPFGGSKPVCICSLDGNTNVKMLETCRHCYNVVTYILKMTELPPGLEKNNIPNYVHLCWFHVLLLLPSLCLCQRFLPGLLRGLLQWFLTCFCIQI